MTLPWSYVISWDLETSGILPRNLVETPYEQFPTIVQLGWCVTTPEGELLHSECRLVQPRMQMHADAIARHGIPQAYAEEHGEDPAVVIDEFLNVLEAWKSSALLIGWNSTFFDFPVLQLEAWRLEREFEWTDYQIFDVMHALARGGGKWQKLEDVYDRLFGTGLAAHDAEADAVGTAMIFHRLLKEKRIDPAKTLAGTLT